LTEYSKRNSNNNISYKNSTFNKNNRGSTGQIKNVKYLTLNEKVNNSCKNSKHKKPSILSTLYYNYKDNTENNTFLKNNMLRETNNNKKAISFEQPEISNKQKDIRDFIYEKGEKKYKYEYTKDLDSTSKKSKKLISDKKAKKNKLNINNKNSFLNNKCNLNNNYNNGDFLYLKFEDEDLNKNSITDKKNIKNDKDNYIFSYGNQNMKRLNYVMDYNNNNLEKNFNSWGNYKTQGNIRDHNSNPLRQNISKSLNSKNIIMNNSNIKKNKFKNTSNNDNDIGNSKEKINLLLNMLNANNINDGIMKVNNLLNYERDINKLKEIYSKNNNNEKYKIDKNGKWLSNIINNYKRNEKYKYFCQNIMDFYKIKNFEEFKMFIKVLLNKNKKNKKDYSNGKNIINGKLDDNNYVDKNLIDNSKFNNSIIKKDKNLLYIEENYKDNDSHNSEDIKISNIQNLKIITDYMHTYY
jgi:hypothetical protein